MAEDWEDWGLEAGTGAENLELGWGTGSERSEARRPVRTGPWTETTRVGRGQECYGGWKLGSQVLGH